MVNNPQDQDNSSPEKKKTAPRQAGPNLWVLIALLAAISVIFLTNQNDGPKQVDYGFFKSQLSKGNIEYLACLKPVCS